MKFDSNLAWKQASSLVSANRDVVLAIAGVFSLVPSLAFGLFFPPPEATAGQNETQQLAAMQAFLVSALPILIVVGVAQAIGTLAQLALFTDRSRPTVGEAIKQGLAGMPSYIAAQLVLVVGFSVIGGLVLALGALTGVAAVAVLLTAAVVLLAIYVWVKTSLVAPVIAVERERNPIVALQRSWRLTKGNSLRIGLFYALLFIAFLIVSAVAAMIVGLVAAAIGGAGAAMIANAIVSAAIGAVMLLYLAAVLAAIHRQLAGPSPEAASTPFE